MSNNKYINEDTYQTLQEVSIETQSDYEKAVEPLWKEQPEDYKDYEIFVATPVHSEVSIHYTQALIEFQQECFKKKLIDGGILGKIHLAENDYRTYDYHGVAQLRNYLGKDSNFVDIKGKTKKQYPLNGSGDTWDIIMAELDNGTTLLYKYTSLYKRVKVRNFKSIRVYGDKGTIISDCLLDNDIEKFSIIWNDGETYHLDINKIYSPNLEEINTTLPDGSVIKWENKFKDYELDEHQIAIAQHIDSMINGKVLWTVEDGFKDLQIL